MEDINLKNEIDKTFKMTVEEIKNVVEDTCSSKDDDSNFAIFIQDIKNLSYDQVGDSYRLIYKGKTREFLSCYATKRNWVTAFFSANFMIAEFKKIYSSDMFNSVLINTLDFISEDLIIETAEYRDAVEYIGFLCFIISTKMIDYI